MSQVIGVVWFKVIHSVICVISLFVLVHLLPWLYSSGLCSHSSVLICTWSRLSTLTPTRHSSFMLICLRSYSFGPVMGLCVCVHSSFTVCPHLVTLVCTHPCPFVLFHSCWSRSFTLTPTRHSTFTLVCLQSYSFGLVIGLCLCFLAGTPTCTSYLCPFMLIDTQCLLPINTINQYKQSLTFL